MTNLKKILDKAVSGGWETDIKWDDLYEQAYQMIDGSSWNVAIEEIIFSIPFLKSFYGEEIKTIRSDFTGEIIDRYIEWQYHGYQQLISEDREKYLMGFVE